MSYDFTILSYVQFLSGFLALFLAYIIWRKNLSNGAIYLVLFELAAGIWAIFDGLGSASTTVSLKLLWAQIAYIGVTTSSVFFLLFALVYTKKDRFVNKGNIILLFVIPCITIILAFTNPFHKLLWSEIVIPEPNYQSVFYYGFWFWIHVFYEYLTLTAGIIILLIHGFKVYKLYRINMWLLLVGSILPFFASILYVFKLTPVKGLDLTPISFIITGIIIAISLFRLKMFDIMPIAHKQVIDNLLVGVLVIDSSDRIVDSNLAFNKIAHLEDRQCIGHKSEEVLAKIDLKIDDFPDTNNLALEKQITVGGETRYFEVKYQKVTDKNDNTICTILTFSDITTRKIVLDSLAESNNWRKNELLEKELLIKDLDAYARSVAHDLKNPINSIVGFTDVIRMKLLGNDSESAIRYLDIIQSQSLKMSKIIDELLKLSIIRKEDVKLIPVDTSKILEDVLKRLDLQIKESTSTILKPNHWPIAMGNQQWLEEIWVNLISNAIKYGGNPPVIKLGYELVSSQTILFYVEDNGNGLPAESMERIFDDFERLGRKDTEGHGLGLAIVKRIVQKLGGQITVSSPAISGKGCLFSFNLQSGSTN